ncbi:porin [Fischerella thermalis CCMEE 5268]|uniref:Porin n=1 Tax=Fischerella thermalis CCMEE 5268 TaxID=2019662 RepID=A0A2N6KKT4_9CYAN|nr:substrate-binding domain-containing protein [Fischerella thermalis]PMB00376.1 porin [Fischerella thermalis CCMEE 5268]
MRKRKKPPPIVFILLFFLLVAAWWYLKPPYPDNLTDQGNIDPNPPVSFPLQQSIPPGTEIRIDGSTSMVTINKKLRLGFEGRYPKTKVVTLANGSEIGIEKLINGEIDIAAYSCDLTDEQNKQGLRAIKMGDDAIAIVVGRNNSFKGGLTDTQVADIFKGKITRWSQVGGSSDAIRVVNRPDWSCTHKSFKKLVLSDSDFGTGANFITLKKDETTGLIRELNNDGIGYATYEHANLESTARIVTINNTNPGASQYPYQRRLFYVYKNPPNDAVKAFLGYATSPQIKQGL